MKKLGFYKGIQGSFTKKRIEEIKNKLVENFDIELIEVDFRKGVLIDGKVYVDDVCLNELDAYFWHDTIWPSLTGPDSYYLHLLRAIENDVIVINSASGTELVNDKLRAHMVLRDNNLPVSKFALVRSDDRSGIERAFNELGGKVLIKPRFGGWGTGIVKIESLSDLYSVIELSASTSRQHQQFLLEKYYENDPEGWISISMIGQDPIIAYRKSLSLSGSDWKIYDPEKKDGKGVESEYVVPSGELIEIARQAQKALNKDIVGFDFISTKEGYKIVDENGRPGLYEHCLQEAKKDLVDIIVQLITDKMNLN